MPHILVADLVKTFQIAERQPGTWGALRGLVRSGGSTEDGGAAILGAHHMEGDEHDRIERGAKRMIGLLSLDNQQKR